MTCAGHPSKESAGMPGIAAQRVGSTPTVSANGRQAIRRGAPGGIASKIGCGVGGSGRVSLLVGGIHTGTKRTAAPLTALSSYYTPNKRIFSALRDADSPALTRYAPNEPTTHNSRVCARARRTCMKRTQAHPHSESECTPSITRIRSAAKHLHGITHSGPHATDKEAATSNP